MGSGNKKVIFALSLFVAAIFAACGKVANISGSGGGGSTNPSPTPLPNFELIIQTTPESADTTPGPTSVLQADCKDPNAAYGASFMCTNAVGVVSNSVTIPEAELYFSTLSFTVNAGDSVNCYIATFNPYYYVADTTSTTFTPPWVNGISVDCTASPLPVACYGGIAQDIVTGFPNYGGMYFLTAEGNTSTYTSKSANKRSYGSNRYAVSNLAVTNAHIQFGTIHAGASTDEYVANSFVPYTVACDDQFGQSVYSITLTITDQDLLGTYPNSSQGLRTINQFPDWDPASWDR